MALKSPKQSCGTCKFLDVPLGENGLPKFKRSITYRCLYVVPPVALPDSITQSPSFRDTFAMNARMYMERYYGEQCPTWTAWAEPGDA